MTSKLSNLADPSLLALYATMAGEISATETRDGVDYVSISFEDVEICGIPSSWIEEVDVD